MPNTEPNSTVLVVAGIIWHNEEKKLLITRRPKHLHKGGFWEFPGGKVEESESLKSALKRELKEELGLVFSTMVSFDKIHFTYPEKKVHIHFFNIFDLTTIPVPAEGQAMAWVGLDELVQYRFPEANLPILEKLLNER